MCVCVSAALEYLHITHVGSLYSGGAILNVECIFIMAFTYLFFQLFWLMPVPVLPTIVVYTFAYVVCCFSNFCVLHLFLCKLLKLQIKAKGRICKWLGLGDRAGREEKQVSHLPAGSWELPRTTFRRSSSIFCSFFIKTVNIF